MSIAVPGVPASRKTPGVAFNVILGGAGTSAGIAPVRIMLLGNMIATAITGSSPTLSVAAGTASVENVYPVASDTDALALFGAGSELHRMSAAVLSQYPSATLFACPVAESGGTAASGVLTFATTATAAGTVRFNLCGEVIDVAVASGDTVTTIAAAAAAAINNANALPYTAQNSSGVLTVEMSFGAGAPVPDPYTAQNSSGVLTFTAKHKGPRGNVDVVDAYFLASGAVTATRITTSSTASGFGTTGTWSSTGTIGNEITLSSGSTADNFANALAAIEPSRYDRIVVACIDSTNLGRVSTALTTQAGPTIQKLQQGIAASVDTYANSISLAAGLNAARMSMAWHFASALPPPDVAAQYAAARVGGDAGVASAAIPGEGDDPAANLNGLELATITAQRTVADQPTATEIENALNNGLTPLAPSVDRPGFVTVVKAITTRASANGVPNYAVLGTQSVTVPDYVADFLRSDLRTTYRGFKLAPDSADGLPPTAPRVVTPSIARGHIARRLAAMEAQGILINVAANLPLLVVEIDTNNPARLNCEIPAAVIPGLDIIAGNIRQL